MTRSLAWTPSGYPRFGCDATMMQFLITGDEITASENYAWVTCPENGTSVGDGRVSETRVPATNIYTLQDRFWMMAHYHGSLVMQPG